MNLNNEKSLLFFIKYALPSIVILLSIITTSFLYIENKYNFKEIKKVTEKKFIEDKKQLIKEQVDSVYNYIIKEQEDIEKNLKKSLINRVREAHKIAVNINNDFKDSYSKEDLTLMIRSSLKDIRFNNNRGYFFVYDKKATNIIHPLIPKLEGKNLINHKDTKGTFVLKDSLELLENEDEAHQEWYWRKSKDDLNEYKKIGFIKNIYELDWFIGTGEYFDDFSKDTQQKVLSQIEKFKFGNNGYIFIINPENIYLSSHRKGIKGKSVFKQNNLKNTIITMNQMWEKAKEGGGFVRYTQKINPITNEPTVKVAYLRTIPQWNWLIGTGFYINEVKELINKQNEVITAKQNKNIRNILIIALTTSLFLLILSIYISKIIKDKFLQHQVNKEALIKSENRFKHIIQQSPYSIELYDLDGFQKEVNPAYEKLWEIDSKLTLNNFNLLTSKEFKATGLLQYVQRAYKGETVQVPLTEFDPKDIPETAGKGRARILNTKIYPIKDIDEKIENIVIVHEDITEKESARKQLRQKKKELEQIIEEAPNPIILHNEDGKVLMINKVWEQISGYDSHEMDTIDKWVANAYDKDITIVKKHIKSLYSIDKKVDEGEFTFLTKNSDPITWQFSSAPFGMIDGKRVIITSAMDVTELKKKNVLLHQQSKMAAMGEMLGNIAHQWRQPLSTISTAATGTKLQKEMDSLKDEDLLTAMDAINKSAQYLSQTIEDFRGFFSPKNNEEYIFKISNTIDKTLKLVSAQFVTNEIQIIQNVDDLELNSFENELIQVLVNILNNARDALISSKNEEKLIFLNAFKENNCATIEILDNAGGINNEIIDRIFEPYFTTKHKSQGTGIGLYMSQDILKNIFNSTIVVKNEEFTYEQKKYKGAKFSIKLQLIE